MNHIFTGSKEIPFNINAVWNTFSDVCKIDNWHPYMSKINERPEDNQAVYSQKFLNTVGLYIIEKIASEKNKSIVFSIRKQKKIIDKDYLNIDYNLFKINFTDKGESVLLEITREFDFNELYEDQDTEEVIERIRSFTENIIDSFDEFKYDEYSEALVK